MKQLRTAVGIGLALGVAAFGLASVTAFAVEEPEDSAGVIARGEASYRAYCASCHGPQGDGEGIVTEYLTVKPSDLRALPPGPDGEFPFGEIYDVIDGRSVAAHGTREMPVWGPAFMGMDQAADKKVVKEKVVELVYYLKSIQRAVEE